MLERISDYAYYLSFLELFRGRILVKSRLIVWMRGWRLLELFKLFVFLIWHQDGLLCRSKHLPIIVMGLSCYLQRMRLFYYAGWGGGRSGCVSLVINNVWNFKVMKNWLIINLDLHLGFLNNFEFIVAGRLRKLEKLIVIVQIHLAFVDCRVFICRILIILIQNKRPRNGFILWNNLAYNRRLNLQDSFLCLVHWAWIYADLALKRISVIQKVNNLLGLGKFCWDRNPIKLLQCGFRDGLLNGFNQFRSLG